ncbi:Calmodulin-regulated spectrin-associated protein 1, partial [Bienertia sinuspersici]
MGDSNQQLKSDALLEQMKTHLTADAGKEIIDKKIEFNEFVLSYFHPQVSRCGGGCWAVMMNEQWWV